MNGYNHYVTSSRKESQKHKRCSLLIIGQEKTKYTANCKSCVTKKLFICLFNIFVFTKFQKKKTAFFTFELTDRRSFHASQTLTHV